MKNSSLLNLAKGFREWGWVTIPLKTYVRGGLRVVDVGAATTPPSNTAYVDGATLVITEIPKKGEENWRKGVKCQVIEVHDAAPRQAKDVDMDENRADVAAVA